MDTSQYQFYSKSNNYAGELVGIQIALEFLSELDHSDLVDRSIHLFTDCQPAIITAFDKKPPTSKIEIVTKIKECCNILYSKGNSMNGIGYQVIRISGAMSWQISKQKKQQQK